MIVQFHLLFLIRSHLGPFFNFWDPSELFLGLGSKTFLGLAYVDNQFWFWKYSPIFLFCIRPNFGPFCTFLGSSGVFLG